MPAPVKAAIIDLYDGYPNEAISSFKHLLAIFAKANGIVTDTTVFNLRGDNEAPGMDFDVYISSGGPGNPIDSEGSEWELKYWHLIDALERHNLSAAVNKKHVLFICHSFQLICRKYGLGTVNRRSAESYGIMPACKTGEAKFDPIMRGLPDPYYIFDSREWQVVNPDMKRFEETGATLLSIERSRTNPANPRALMAIRLNPYFFATQYHPETDPNDMKHRMQGDGYKQRMISEYGQAKYDELLSDLDDPEKLLPAYRSIIPGFLEQALGPYLK